MGLYLATAAMPLSAAMATGRGGGADGVVVVVDSAKADEAVSVKKVIMF